MRSLRIVLTSILLVSCLGMKANTSSDFDVALQMLARFTPYIYNSYQPIDSPNSAGEEIATFKGENTFGNNEQGVRHNADLSMICAFLCKYAKDKVSLPSPLTWEQLEKMAHTTLVYAYSTHKANKLYPCKGEQYWGSMSNADHSWESSLWAMSVAYSAFFQWDKLTDAQHTYIYNMLKAECNYELERGIPTNVKGDTKAEENGWECDVLAATIGLFPDDPLAEKWFQRLREFAINSYSHSSDKDNTTVIDSEYDNKTVADLYKGANLYDDFTLQNHDYFHTSYQNVVVQELGEAALALTLFQKELHGKERWKTNALMHNIDKIMKDVLYGLALHDGELAMPNGNDWSLFLYDQITSYSTASCFLRDNEALMLELRALKQIEARQKTTDDGSWLLRADVGARRMGVEAHRVMMTWLMHHVLPTDDIKPVSWEDFLSRHSSTNYYPQQDVITASSDKRFTCFSWSEGLKSYTGYFAPVTDEQNNIIVPYRANNTGNYIGWYEVEGKRIDAKDISHRTVESDGNSYIITGTLNTNGSTLQNNYMIFATKNNLVLYFDMTHALTDATITKEYGGLLAISTDPFTKTERTLYSENGPTQSDGEGFLTIKTDWINIDNCVGVLAKTSAESGNMAFGNRQNNNSILTSKLYASYSDRQRTVHKDELVDTRVIAYYSNVSADETRKLREQMRPVAGLPKNCQGTEVHDTDGSVYLVLQKQTDKKVKLNLSKLQQQYNAALILLVSKTGDNASVQPIKVTNETKASYQWQ